MHKCHGDVLAVRSGGTSHRIGLLRYVAVRFWYREVRGGGIDLILKSLVGN